MHQSKLIQLLRTLTDKEVKKLGSFLNSPYHNQNKKVIALYDLLKKYHGKKYESNRLQKETFFYKIFPQGTHYQDNNMRGLMAALHRCVEDFLMLEQLKAKKEMQQTLKKQVYINKNLYGRFEKLSVKAIDELEKDFVFELSNNQQLYQLNYDYYFHAQTEKYKKGVPNLEASMRYLDLFYVQAKLRLGLEMKNREKILKEKYDIFLWENISLQLPKNKLLYNPIVKIYKNCLQLIEIFEESLFSETIKLFIKNIQQSGDWEKRAFIMLLINFTNQQIRLGERKYFQPQFELLKTGFNFDLFIINGILNPQLFLSAITSGLRQKAFDWVDKFFIDYQHLLPESRKVDLLKLGQVIIDYQKGLHLNDNKYFESALTTLAHIDVSVSANVLFPRILRTRIYYDFYLQDNKNLDFLLDTISAFQKYLNRSKDFPESKKLPYKKFNQITRKLAQVKCNPFLDSRMINDLETTILEENQLTSKYWLIEKVEELYLLNSSTN